MTMIGSKRSRAKTLALLCLMAHALFVCFTHFHENAPPLSTVSVTASSDGDSHSSPGSTGDSHCLSCRLQRNFVSGTHTAPVIIESIEEPLTRSISLAVLNSRGSRQSLSTRAPPLA